MPASTNENMIAGPAWADATCPVRTKIPAPMMAPMPRLIRFSGPRVRFSSLFAASFWICAIDFLRNRRFPFGPRPSADMEFQTPIRGDTLPGRLPARTLAMWTDCRNPVHRAGTMTPSPRGCRPLHPALSTSPVTGVRWRSHFATCRARGTGSPAADRRRNGTWESDFGRTRSPLGTGPMVIESRLRAGGDRIRRRTGQSLEVPDGDREQRRRRLRAGLRALRGADRPAAAAV